MLELYSEYLCIYCGQIIHIACGIVVDKANDKYQCPIDCRKPVVIIVAPPPIPLVNEANKEVSISWASFYYVETNETKQEACEWYVSVVDVASPNSKPIESVFKVMQKNQCRQSVEVALTPEVIVKKFFTKEIVSRIINNSNRHRE